MKIKTVFSASVLYLLGVSFAVFSQEATVLRTIPLSPSSSLVIKRIIEPLALSTGKALSAPPGFAPLNLPKVKETYVVVLRSANSESDLQREEFRSAQGAEDSVMPRFAVYDAVLDGGTLHYLFTKKGKVYLAIATISASGDVSGYRQRLTGDTFSAIEDAHFVKDRQGRTTLRIRKMGKKIEAFQFDSMGEAVSVSPEQIASPSQ
jgi:hypothetical protein